MEQKRDRRRLIQRKELESLINEYFISDNLFNKLIETKGNLDESVCPKKIQRRIIILYNCLIHQ